MIHTNEWPLQTKNFKQGVRKMPGKTALSVAAILFFLVSGCAVNPITGEEQFMLIPESQELEIGQAYAPEIEKQMGGRIPNEAVQAYIDSIGQRIARVSHRPDIHYHFAALDHKAINAFALPGGYIFVTKGMLEKLNNESELASVLAHETTHVVARHATEAMSRQIGIQLLLVAAVSSTNSAVAAQAADVAQQIIGLQFSREDERQADQIGMDYMVTAGYDPNGMVETMKMLERENETGPIDFLSSHPSPQNRITYLTGRIESRYSNATGLKIGTEEYRHAVLDRLPK
jgi:predicted Zn-dependent protease